MKPAKYCAEIWFNICKYGRDWEYEESESFRTLKECKDYIKGNKEAIEDSDSNIKVRGVVYKLDRIYED